MDTGISLLEFIVQLCNVGVIGESAGLQETVLHFGEVSFRLVDVGGQRSLFSIYSIRIIP